MNNYYFTFGTSETQAYSGGWVIVKAINMHEAVGKFISKRPLVKGLVPCCTWYNEEKFINTEMFKTDNLGSRCHEVIE